jgi:hypothetical protein
MKIEKLDKKNLPIHMLSTGDDNWTDYVAAMLKKINELVDALNESKEVK